MKKIALIPLTIFMVTAALIIVIIAAAVAESKNTSRLIAQCIADGKKEYECEAMLRKNNNASSNRAWFIGK